MTKSQNNHLTFLNATSSYKSHINRFPTLDKSGTGLHFSYTQTYLPGNDPAGVKKKFKMIQMLRFILRFTATWYLNSRKKLFIASILHTIDARVGYLPAVIK